MSKDKKPNHNVTNTFHKDNTVEMEIDGKKVRVFKGDVEAVKKGLKKLAAKGKNADNNTDLAKRLKDAEAQNKQLAKDLEEAKKAK